MLKNICKQMILLAITAIMVLQPLTVFGAVFASGESQDHWAAEYIAFLVSNDLVQGDDQGRMNPDDHITRAEFAALVSRVLGIDEVSGAVVFPDVAYGQWYYRYFASFGHLDIVRGDEFGYANPGADITCAEAATMFVRGVDSLQPQERIQSPSMAPPGADMAVLQAAFWDSAAIPQWAVGSIATLVEYGVVIDFPSRNFVPRGGSIRFVPHGGLTRGEAFALVYRALFSGMLGPRGIASVIVQTGYGEDAAAETAEAEGGEAETTTGVGLLAVPLQTGSGTTANAPPEGDEDGNDGGNGIAPPSANAPFIQVLTPFPSGTVDFSHVDITYTAAPTPGAAITEIFYTINGGSPTYIYISHASNYTQRGTFGSARVFITPVPNNQFVFTMRDSAGGEATYTVANIPTLGGWIIVPEQDHAYVYWFQGERGDIPYVQTDRIHIATHWDYENRRPSATREEIADFAHFLGGRIIGMSVMTGSYTIGFDILRTYAELLELVEYITTHHANIVYRASLNYGAGSDNHRPYVWEPIIIQPGEGGQDLYFFREPIVQSSRHPTNDPFWGELHLNETSQSHEYPKDWGQNALFIPHAWTGFGNHQRQIQVGVLDTWFDVSHTDPTLSQETYRLILLLPAYAKCPTTMAAYASSSPTPHTA